MTAMVRGMNQKRADARPRRWPICWARPAPAAARRGRERRPARRGRRAAARPGPSEQLTRLPLDLLQRGRYQPRLDMRAESLTELADSIRAQGVVQPIVVRPLDAPDERGVQRYEIIAGERRWRAAQQAGSARHPGGDPARAG